MDTDTEKLQRRREDCRRDTLAFLALRSPNAFRNAAIKELINRDMSAAYSATEIMAAVIFLEQMGHVQRIPDPFGTNDHFRASSQGQLAYERSQV